MKRGNCYGQAPNLREHPEAKDPWFPGKGESLNTGKIKCFTCRVRSECDDFKERIGATHGMWAGQIVKRDKEEEDGPEPSDER